MRTGGDRDGTGLALIEMAVEAIREGNAVLRHACTPAISALNECESSETLRIGSRAAPVLMSSDCFAAAENGLPASGFAGDAILRGR